MPWVSGPRHSHRNHPTENDVSHPANDPVFAPEGDEYTCALCGHPCELVDNMRHMACEQEENARIAEWEWAESQHDLDNDR